MSFRVNHETESPQAVAGDLHVTLEKVSRPALVDKDGKTTISTRVAKTKYLLFEPEGIRWQYSSQQGAMEEADSPTLINGIAWWPRPDQRDTEGWNEFALTSRAPLLKTHAFAWAADPKKPKPRIAMPDSRGFTVTPQGPTPEDPGLMFTGRADAPRFVTCTFSQ